MERIQTQKGHSYLELCDRTKKSNSREQIQLALSDKNGPGPSVAPLPQLYCSAPEKTSEEILQVYNIHQIQELHEEVNPTG